LDAYNSQGKLIRRFQSASLSNGTKVTMRVNSDTADIAYVIARATNNTKIKLDNLVLGPATETRTSANGSYVLPGIPTGVYQVEVTPPTALEAVQPNTGLRTASVVVGAPLTHVDFILAASVSPWQNQTRRHDVNNDGLITALDVLIVINEINRNGVRPLDGSAITSPPFYDVDGNRSIEALDVLIVINFINANPGSGEGESAPLVDVLSTETELRKRKANSVGPP